ncbi:MAG: NDP-sugar synthase [Acidilobaceae archaeon]|nr:NDP-sugar synthase [Acidilobaceae archaeon]
MNIIPVSKALIPIGGLGTRLYPITVETSKAMVRFLNTFLINFILQGLATEGIEEVYLGVSGYLNYRALHDHLGNGLKVKTPRGGYRLIRIRYQPNEDSVGNAHSARILLKYYRLREPILVLQGDTVAKINVRSMYKRHKEAGAFMTIALKEVQDEKELKHFGVARLDESWLIKGFVEKPKSPAEAPSRWVNTGIYLLSEEMIDFLLSEDFEAMIREGKGDFGADVIPRIVKEGKVVAGHRLEGYWFDIGTPERYLEATFYLLRVLEEAALDVTTSYKGVKMQGTSPASRFLQVELIEKAATKVILFEGDVLLGRHIRIGDGARVERAVVDNYTVLEEGVTVRGSVVMDRCHVGSGALVEDSIVGRHSRVGAKAKVVRSYIGDNVTIEEGAQLYECKVWPHRVVKANEVCKGESII